MNEEKETDKNADEHVNFSPSDLMFTSKDDVENLMSLFASEKQTVRPLLDHFFSVHFEDVDDYSSFFDRLYTSPEKVKPLLHELTNVEALLVYFKDTKWANHPMVEIFQSDYDSPLNFLLLFENSSDRPEFPIDTWRLLDFFLAEPSDNRHDIPWAGQIKNALFYAAMQCDLESESDMFMNYFERVVEKLGPRRDVKWSAFCFFLRKDEGKSRKEIIEIDPWEFY